MRSFLFSVLGLPLLVQAQTPPSPAQKKATGVSEEGKLPLRARLTDEVIRQAVRDTRAEESAERSAAPSGQILRADRAEAFARAFTYAQKPSCTGSDALKFQPSDTYTKNWHFSASGLMALPFWASAIVKGKCK
jgi:hypothetical protein